MEGRPTVKTIAIAFLSCVFWSISGCATKANYIVALNSWIGQPEQELVSVWGAPDTSFESGGQRFLTYNNTGSNGTIGSRGGCKSTFTVENNIVIRTAYAGSGCKSE